MGEPKRTTVYPADSALDPMHPGSAQGHREDGQPIIYGLYDDEVQLIDAVKAARERHLEVFNVYTPFPVHGLDPQLGLAESRLHVAGFVYGLCGTLLAFGFMTWVFTRDWPLIIGGKPYFSAPAFIPITFELTVLFAAIGMTVSFYLLCGLGPGSPEQNIDDRITDDKFCLAFSGADASDPDGYADFLRETGASEVHTKTI